MQKTNSIKTKTDSINTALTANFYDIPGYEGLYQINHSGDILSVNYANRGYSQVLRQYTNNKGYQFVRLAKDRKVLGKTIHRLLAQTFIHNPNPSVYTDVNHLDENPQNNALNNLEWTTHRHNLNHGTSRIRTVLAHCKPVAQLNEQGETLATYTSIKEAARATKLTTDSISDTAKGKRKSAGGYYWQFVKEPLKTIQKLYEQERCIGDF